MSTFRCRQCGREYEELPASCFCGNTNPALWEADSKKTPLDAPKPTVNADITTDRTPPAAQRKKPAKKAAAEKKSKTPVLIAIVLIVAILAATACYLIPKLLDSGFFSKDGSEKGLNGKEGSLLTDADGNPVPADGGADGAGVIVNDPWTDETIMKILSGQKLSDSGTYNEYFGAETIVAYAEERTNAFSVNTAADFNMWGGNVQSVDFKIEDLTFDMLSFIICGESGTSDKTLVEVFIDRPADDSSPDYAYTLHDACLPVQAEIDIAGKKTMAIRVTNQCGHENRIVFYGFDDHPAKAGSTPAPRASKGAWDGEAIMKTLSEQKLADSGPYNEYFGADVINAYGADRTNAFSMNTAADFNMWGGNLQHVDFRIDTFNFDRLKFTICGENGTSGTVQVDIFIDRPIDESTPDYSFTLNDAPYPVEALIDIAGKQTMSIRVENRTGHENRIVFYGFEEA